MPLRITLRTGGCMHAPDACIPPSREDALASKRSISDSNVGIGSGHGIVELLTHVRHQSAPFPGCRSPAKPRRISTSPRSMVAMSSLKPEFPRVAGRLDKIPWASNPGDAATSSQRGERPLIPAVTTIHTDLAVSRPLVPPGRARATVPPPKGASRPINGARSLRILCRLPPPRPSPYDLLLPFPLLNPCGSVAFFSSLPPASGPAAALTP